MQYMLYTDIDKGFQFMGSHRLVDTKADIQSYMSSGGNEISAFTQNISSLVDLIPVLYYISDGKLYFLPYYSYS